MEPFTLQWAAESLQARMAEVRADIVTNVTIDSRQVTAGSLFFALTGEQADGHDFVGQAFARGAVGAVVSREPVGVNGPLLLVPDTLQALGDLAQHYRRQFTIPVIGITGSVGKTSTKEMIAAVLGTRYKTLANKGNLNTEIGVPLTLFQLDRSHEAAVIEMGMRGIGQIERLAEIAQPTMGVITNIGLSHIELLRSQEQIAQAKSELLTHLPIGGCAVLPRDSAFFDFLSGRTPSGCRRITFSSVLDSSVPEVSADVALRTVTVDQDSRPTLHLRVGSHACTVHLQAIGAHHGPNAAAAMAVGYALQIGLAEATVALEQWSGAKGRMVLRETPDGVTVLDDCYNAAIESMRAALQTLESLTTQRPGIAVLGEMRELGAFAEEAHLIVGECVGRSDHIRLLITVGELADRIESAASHYRIKAHKPPVEVRRFTSSEAAAKSIRDLVRSGDVVLVKGSRAMEMEQIVAALTGVPGGEAHG